MLELQPSLAQSLRWAELRQNTCCVRHNEALLSRLSQWSWKPYWTLLRQPLSIPTAHPDTITVCLQLRRKYL